MKKLQGATFLFKNLVLFIPFNIYLHVELFLPSKISSYTFRVNHIILIIKYE